VGKGGGPKPKDKTRYNRRPDTDTRIKLLALANGYGRYITVIIPYTRTGTLDFRPLGNGNGRHRYFYNRAPPTTGGERGSAVQHPRCIIYIIIHIYASDLDPLSTPLCR
jgi:hypothetical protein